MEIEPKGYLISGDYIGIIDENHKTMRFETEGAYRDYLKEGEQDVEEDEAD